MSIIYKNNKVEDLRREASRRDSGIYVVQELGGRALLAAAKISLTEERGAPKYGYDSRLENPIYMGLFGVHRDISADDWSEYLKGMVNQAREDFGQSGRGRVTKFCAYTLPDADRRFAGAVEGINPRTYRMLGGESGSFGKVGNVPGRYLRHDVKFELPADGIQRLLGRAALSSSFPWDSSRRTAPHAIPVPASVGSTEEELPIAA